MSSNRVVAVDFDGTIVTHAYPEMGGDLGAIAILKELQANGCRLVLHTMRSGALLEKAVDWCKLRGLEFWAVNSNPDQKEWTASPKVYADLYIDDAALGVPLKFIDGVKRPAVDWTKVRAELIRYGYIEE